MMRKGPQQQQQQQQQRHRPQQPLPLQNDTYSVPRSVSTDDDDDDKDENNHDFDVDKENIVSKQVLTSAARKNVVVETNSNHSIMVVENYLLQYEHMVQQQEMEDRAVMAHLLPCIQRLMELIHDSNTTTGGSSSSTTPPPQYPIQLHHEISYPQLYRAYQQLLQIKMKSSGTVTHHNSVMTITAMECMTTDRQLMMILRTLTEHMPFDSTMYSTDDDIASLSMTWAEFIQCYKVCIYSMMTLQHLPNGSMARLRTRDRSLSMMALFGPSTTATSLAASMGLTDVYLTTTTTPMPHTIETAFTQEKLISSSTTKETAVSTTVSLPKTSLRRRPWLKKRTKRMLPYLLFITLLTMIGFWYFTHVVGVARKQWNDTEENMISASETAANKGRYQPPSFPSNSIAAPHKNPSTRFVPQKSLPNGNNRPSKIVADSTNAQNRHQSSEMTTPLKNHKTNLAPQTNMNNDTFTSYDGESAAPMRYHPLLGIWSNFNQW